MTKAEEKGNEILQKITDALMDNEAVITKQSVKACALICVDEILAEISRIESFAAREYKIEPINFWQQVKQFISNPEK